MSNPKTPPASASAAAPPASVPVTALGPITAGRRRPFSSSLGAMALAMLIVQLCFFVQAIWRLQANTGELDTKFTEVATDRFLGYMALVNLKVLGGYLLIWLGSSFLAYPLLQYWITRKEAKKGRSIGFAGWFWRGGVLACLVWGFYFLRFFYARPFYFTLNPSLQAIYDAVAGWLPNWGKDVLFYALPWIFCGAVCLHYITNVLQKFLAAWPRSACRAVGLLGSLALAMLCYVGTQVWSRSRVVVKKDNRPNILVLASDSLRGDHISANGYARPTTPNIDALAEKSVNFTKCLTPIASTVESLTSMSTGQYPHTHGLQHMFPNEEQVRRMQANSPTLASMLKKSGYETAVIGDWCAGVYDLLGLGFQRRDVSTFDNFKVFLTQAVYKEHAVLPLFFDNPLGYWLFPDLKNCASFVTPEVATERVKESLSKAAESDKPFFIKAFYSITHLPYSINPPYSLKFTDASYTGPHRGRMDLDIGQFIGSVDIANKWRQMPQADVDQIIGLYDGTVAKFDDTVGSILEHLRKTGQAENTIVLVTSDHGDDLFEPNCTFGHGLTFNGGDQNTHIPAVLHLPGRLNQGKKIQKVVRSIDFAPTLLELAGLTKDKRMEGVSLMPYVDGTSQDLSLAYFGETSYLFCKRHIPGEEPLFIPAMDETTEVDEDFDCHMVLKDKYQDLVIATKERCLRTQDWKVVFTPGKHYDIWRLFHLPTDPHCEKPLQREMPEIFKPMQEALLKWMREKQELRIKDIFPLGEPAKPEPAVAQVGPTVISIPQ